MTDRYKPLTQQAGEIAALAGHLAEPSVETIRQLDALGNLVDHLRRTIAQERGGTMASLVEHGTLQSDLAADLGISTAAVSQAIAGRARSPREITREALEILGSHLGNSPVQTSAWTAATGLAGSAKRNDRLAVARRVQQITRNLQPAQLAAMDQHERHTVMLAAGLAAKLLAPNFVSESD